MSTSAPNPPGNTPLGASPAPERWQWIGNDWTVIAFCVVVFLIVMLFQFRSWQAKSAVIRSIDRVLDADAQTTTGSKSVAETATRMQAIDLQGCSPEFVEAYEAHIQAWQAAAELEARYAKYDARFNSTSGMLESFLRECVLDSSMTRAAATEFEELRNLHARTSARIRQTFRVVELQALLAGAKLRPDSRK